MVNFSGETVAFCFDMLILKHDLLTVRERIKDNGEEGLCMAAKLKNMKKITAGQLFKARVYRVGKDIFEIYKKTWQKTYRRIKWY